MVKLFLLGYVPPICYWIMQNQDWFPPEGLHCQWYAWKENKQLYDRCYKRLRKTEPSALFLCDATLRSIFNPKMQLQFNTVKVSFGICIRVSHYSQIWISFFLDFCKCYAEQDKVKRQSKKNFNLWDLLYICYLSQSQPFRKHIMSAMSNIFKHRNLLNL